jgi:hypothetical protein
LDIVFSTRSIIGQIDEHNELSGDHPCNPLTWPLSIERSISAK